MLKRLTIAAISCCFFGVLSLLLQPAPLRGQGLGFNVRIKGGVEFNRNEEAGLKPCNPFLIGGGMEVKGLIPGFNLEAGIRYSSKGYSGYTSGELGQRYRTKIDYDHLFTNCTIRTSRFLTFEPIESYWGLGGAVHYFWISHKPLDKPPGELPPTSWKRYYHRLAIEGLVGFNLDIPHFPLGFFLEGCFSHLFAKRNEFKNFPYLYSGIKLNLR